MSYGVCVNAATPATGCLAPGKAILTLSDPSADDPSKADKNRLLLKWTKGAAFAFADLGDPVAGTTDYTLCLYDESGGVPDLLLAATVAGGGTCGGAPCWKRLGSDSNPRGYKYVDHNLTADGWLKVPLRSGDAGKTKVIMRGKGVNLPVPGAVSADAYANQDTSVVAQLRRDDAPSICWAASLASPAKKNSHTRFSDRCGSASGPACP